MSFKSIDPGMHSRRHELQRQPSASTRHFATFGLAPAAAFFIPNPARHPFQGWARRFIAITHQKQAKARGRWANADRLTSQPQRSGRSISPSTQASELTPTRRSMQPFIHRDHQKHAIDIDDPDEIGEPQV